MERPEATPRQCSECGRAFMPTNNRQRYCPECRRDIRRRQVGRSVEKHREKPNIFYPETVSN